MAKLTVKRAPAVSSNERAWSQVYDDINDIIKSVNKESTDENRTKGMDGLDGDIRLFKDNVKSKYFIEGKFKDGWAKRELLFSDSNDATQDESINFSSTETYVKPDGTVPFTGRQTGVSPQNTNELATKGYVDGSVTLSGSLDYLTISNQVITRNAIDLAADVTGTLPINKGGTNNTSFTTGKLLQFSSGTINSSSISAGTLLVDIVDTAATAGSGGQHGNLPTDHVCLIEDGGASGNQAKIYNIKSANNRMTISDSSSGGSDFIEFNVADQTLNINRFDTIYHYDDTDANVETSPASGADGIAFVDTSTVTFTVNDQAGSGAYENKVKISAVAANDNTTYSTNASTTSGGANFNLAGANPSSTDTIKFASAGATTVSRTDASTIQISSTNTTNINTTESTGGSFYSLVEDNDTVRALEAGTGIAISVEGQGDGEDVVKISSTVSTSGLLTNGIVTVQDWNGSEVEDTVNASGADTLRFVENNGIEWAISGPTNNVISVTPSLSGYNASNWNTAYDDRLKWDGNSTGLTASTGRTSLGLTGDSNTTHYHDGRYYTESETNTLLGAKAALSGATFTGDISAPNVKSTTSGIIKAVAGTSADRSGLTIYNSAESGYLSYTVTTSDHASGWGWELSNQAANATSPTYSVRVDYTGSTMSVKGDVIAFVSSDPKLKTNKELINNPLDKVMQLGGYSFDWKKEATKHGNHLVGHDYGVMADEVEALFPELVTVRENDGETMKAVDYKKLIPLLIESVKELNRKINEKL